MNDIFEEARDRVFFSWRERQVMTLHAQAKAYKAIAYELDIAESTVKHHVGGLCRKLGLTDGKSLMRWIWEHPDAVEKGVTSDPEIRERLRNVPKAA